MGWRCHIVSVLTRLTLRWLLRRSAQRLHSNGRDGHRLRRVCHFLPVLIVICLFIGSAVVHLCLMIVGGANQSFETTFRVLAFSHGSTGPLQMIPICGGVIAGVWALVCSCIGLERANETDTGRAVLAVFLPVIVCCGGGLLVAFMFGALGAWSASHH